jgi:glycerol-3-phosphate acyltransferase PlsX
MKFIIDCYGGDFSPEEIVKGVILASKKEKEISYVLVGKKEEIESLLENNKADKTRFEIIDAREVFTNNDQPTLIVHGKENTSLSKALMALRSREDVDALLTAGSTGATLAGSIFKIGRVKGVLRPCLMATLPSRTGKLVRVLDIGANMDAKPEYLYQYALMANELVKLTGVDNPRIGLLNVGKEEEKGNELTHAAFKLLKEDKELNFIGNIEGDHVLKGEADIVVCDAFAGNVLIKSLEEAAYFVSDAFQAAIKKNIFTKLGALFQLHELKKVKLLFKYANEASAPLLGIKKLVIKMHGKSKAKNVEAVILETKKLAHGKLNEKIENAVNKA